MASLKLAATPGFLPSDGTVTIRFTEPEEATDVKITVLEADRWTAFGEEESDGDGVERKRAEIFGTIQGRKFTRTNINTFITMVALDPVPPDTKTHLITPGIMNLTVEHDGSQSLVPLQNIDKEKELGFFEIVFEVTANVGGKAMTYRTPAPVFVRNVPSGRGELAFIAGTPKDFPEAYTKPFFPNAREYWKHLRDNLRDEMSIEAILEQIRDIPAEKRGDRPWGTVNIIAHGSPNAWYVRMLAKDEEHRDVTESDLPDDALGAVPDEAVLDSDSLVVLRGCEIGSNQPLLDAICKQFGKKARVYAPLHEMVYRKKGGILTEILFQKWEFEMPGKKPFPADAELKALLKSEYARHVLYGSYSEAQWDAVVAIHATDLGANAFRQADSQEWPDVTGEGFTHDDLFVGSGNQLKNNDDIAQVVLVEASRSLAKKFGWTWNITPQPNTSPQTFAVRGKGVRTFYQIFRILTVTEDGMGPAATPDFHNPRHYGHSS